MNKLLAGWVCAAGTLLGANAPAVGAEPFMGCNAAETAEVCRNYDPNKELVLGGPAGERFNSALEACAGAKIDFASKRYSDCQDNPAISKLRAEANAEDNALRANFAFMRERCDPGWAKRRVCGRSADRQTPPTLQLAGAGTSAPAAGATSRDAQPGKSQTALAKNVPKGAWFPSTIEIVPDVKDAPKRAGKKNEPPAIASVPAGAWFPQSIESAPAPAPKEPKLYTYEVDRAWKTPFPMETEEGAVKAAQKQRTDMEGNMHFGYRSREILSVGEPDCRASNPDAKKPRYLCTITVRYKLVMDKPMVSGRSASTSKAISR